MAHSQRYLILAALFALLAAASSARAQPAAQTADASSFRTLALAPDQEFGGLFYDHQGRQIPLSATHLNLSPPYDATTGGVVVIYRELPPVAPSQKPIRQPVAEVRLDSAGPWLLALARQTDRAAPERSRLLARAFDHSWQTHPAATVRIFNFCTTPVALRLGSDIVELSPGQSRLHPYPAQDHLWLQVAASVNGRWESRLSAPQRIAGRDTRATWALFDRPVTTENPVPRIFVRNLVESAPASP